MNINRQHV